jgi:hypothetical protein
MANYTTKNHINQIFNDLDRYRNFCREYGYRFNEADLYNQKNYIYRQFQKFIAGKPVKNQWEFDLVKFREQRV